MNLLAIVLLAAIPLDLVFTFAIYVLSGRPRAFFVSSSDISTRELLDSGPKKVLFSLSWMARISFFVALVVLVSTSLNDAS